MFSKVCKNCQLSPVMCGQLNLKLLPIDVGSLIKEKICNQYDIWTIKTNAQYFGKLVMFDRPGVAGAVYILLIPFLKEGMKRNGKQRESKGSKGKAEKRGWKWNKKEAKGNKKKKGESKESNGERGEGQVNEKAIW